MSYLIKKSQSQSFGAKLETKKDLLESFKPQTHDSLEYKNWISTLSVTTCSYCRENHGKIFHLYEILEISPPVHNKCGCKIIPMKAVCFGAATQDGSKGVDVYLTTYGKLPPNYISKKEAKNSGWINVLGNLSAVAPGKVVGGDIYQNRNGHLPKASGRIWYEADINYDKGYRNHHRLIYSNDGLIFATYDHYMTFVQIH